MKSITKIVPVLDLKENQQVAGKIKGLYCLNEGGKYQRECYKIRSGFVHRNEVILQDQRCFFSFDIFLALRSVIQVLLPVENSFNRSHNFFNKLYS